MSTKALIFFVVAAALGSSLAAAQEEQLPPDQEVIAQVIHGIKYPLKKKFSVHVALQNYYGDRLARTFGYSIEPRYHLSEKTWISLPVSMFQSELESGVPIPEDGPIVVYEPKITFGPEFGWNPIYGKFLLGERIQHFRAGLHGGLAAIQTQKLAPAWGSSELTWTFGIVLGVQIQAQLGPTWLLDIFSTALIYPGVSEFEYSNSGSNRLGWQYGIRLGKTL
jgi:hypothetical protein